MRHVLASVLVVGLVAAAPAGARVVLAPQGCRAGVERPSQIIFTCGDGGFYVHHLRWSRWGGAVAYGRGEIVANTCKPSCVAGRYVRVAARVHLYNRRRCPGRTRLYYRRTTLIETRTGRAQAVSVPCPF